MRVRELATELRVDHNEVMAILKEKGHDLANYMSNMNDAQIDLVRKTIRARKASGTSAPVAAVVVEPKKPAGKVVRKGTAKKAEEPAEPEPVAAEPEPVAPPRTRITKKAPPAPVLPEPVAAPIEDNLPVLAPAENAVADTVAVAAEPGAEGGEAGRPGGARIIKTGVRIHIPQRNQPRDRGYGAGGPIRRGPAGPRPSMPMQPMPAAPAPSEGSAPSEERRNKAKEVKHPKRRVINKVDKYRHILTEGTANIRARKKTKKDGKDELPVTAPMAAHKRKIRIEKSILVGDLAKQLSVKASDIIKKFLEMGTLVTANQSIDPDTATIIASDYGYEVEVTHQTEEQILAKDAVADSAEDYSVRPPIVTVMGHVDHGKTSILDAIRSANVAAGEAGGITQHIGAYQVEHNGQKITFLDTPGHAAFTAMRARGASVTDIVILVVAANDGVMPQTVEAIKHAQSAKVPIIVAVNKMDVPGANPDRIMKQIADLGVQPEEWGGDAMIVRCSALKREGIDKLLEAVLLQAEVLDLKANAKREFKGVVLEAALDKGRGPVATVLVTDGVLKGGTFVMADKYYGRVRTLLSDTGAIVKEAQPGTPVVLQGLNGVPAAGDIIVETKSEKVAKEIVERRRLKERESELAKRNKVSIEDIFAQGQGGKVNEVMLLVKGDVHGSVEALKDALEAQSTAEIKVKVVYAGVGAITENDVNLASASKASIIGFNIRPDSKCAKLAERLGVEIRPYTIIYEVLDDVKKAMLGTLAPEEKEESLGWVRIKEIFGITGVGTVAGSLVESGKAQRGAGVRLIRGGKVIYQGVIENLRRFKDDVKEVPVGQECGILLKNHNDVLIGDEMEIFQIVKIQRTQL